MTERNTINGLALCAGTGGLELGLHIALPGLRTVCFVEREASAAASLVARMEDATLDTAPIWDDLGTFDGKPWRGSVDILTSGDPCQPNSTAGKRQGEDDDRWLLDQVIRIIDEVRPARVFRENVTGNADGQLRVLVPALEAMGYSVAVGIFSASEVGGSHRRERLFILADAIGSGHHGWTQGAQRLSFKRTATQRSGVTMGNTASTRLQKRGGRQETMGQPRKIVQSERPSGGDMAHTNGPELRTDCGEPNTQSDGRDDITGGSTKLAYASGTGLQGSKRAGSSIERNGTPAHGSTAELCRARIPLFAPGPSDFAAWSIILDHDWSLSPALGPVDIWTVARGRLGLPQVVDQRRKGGMAQGLDKTTTAELKREVCRISHELAYRNDRLRLCGNGVFPLAAAYAYTTLAAHFDAAGTGSTDAVLSVK